MYNRVREIPRTYADMGYRLQRFRVILMTSIAIMIVVTAVCLFVHPTSGGALLVLALGGSLAALILDYRRRERENRLTINREAMKKKNAQFNKKTATVALIFMLATIMWLTINVVWCLHDGHYANLIIPVLFVVAGVAMFYNEFHKKPRKHVEDVKKYL